MLVSYQMRWATLSLACSSTIYARPAEVNTATDLVDNSTSLGDSLWMICRDTPLQLRITSNNTGPRLYDGDIQLIRKVERQLLYSGYPDLRGKWIRENRRGGYFVLREPEDPGIYPQPEPDPQRETVTTRWIAPCLNQMRMYLQQSQVPHVFLFRIFNDREIVAEGGLQLISQGFGDALQNAPDSLPGLAHLNGTLNGTQSSVEAISRRNDLSNAVVHPIPSDQNVTRLTDRQLYSCAFGGRSLALERLQPGPAGELPYKYFALLHTVGEALMSKSGDLQSLVQERRDDVRLKVRPGTDRDGIPPISNEAVGNCLAETFEIMRRQSIMPQMLFNIIDSNTDVQLAGGSLLQGSVDAISSNITRMMERSTENRNYLETPIQTSTPVIHEEIITRPLVPRGTDELQDLIVPIPCLIDDLSITVLRDSTALPLKRDQVGLLGTLAARLLLAGTEAFVKKISIPSSLGASVFLEPTQPPLPPGDITKKQAAQCLQTLARYFRLSGDKPTEMHFRIYSSDIHVVRAQGQLKLGALSLSSHSNDTVVEISKRAAAITPNLTDSHIPDHPYAAMQCALSHFVIQAMGGIEIRPDQLQSLKQLSFALRSRAGISLFANEVTIRANGAATKVVPFPGSDSSIGMTRNEVGQCLQRLWLSFEDAPRPPTVLDFHIFHVDTGAEFVHGSLWLQEPETYQANTSVTAIARRAIDPDAGPSLPTEALQHVSDNYTIAASFNATLLQNDPSDSIFPIDHAPYQITCVYSPGISPLAQSSDVNPLFQALNEQVRLRTLRPSILPVSVLRPCGSKRVELTAVAMAQPQDVAWGYLAGCIDQIERAAGMRRRGVYEGRWECRYKTPGTDDRTRGWLIGWGAMRLADRRDGQGSVDVIAADNLDDNALMLLNATTTTTALSRRDEIGISKRNVTTLGGPEEDPLFPISTADFTIIPSIVGSDRWITPVGTLSGLFDSLMRQIRAVAVSSTRTAVGVTGSVGHDTVRLEAHVGAAAQDEPLWANWGHLYDCVTSIASALADRSKGASEGSWYCFSNSALGRSFGWGRISVIS